MTDQVKSADKKRKYAMNGFVKDENGEFHIIPMKLPEFPEFASSAQLSAAKSGEKRTVVRRPYIPIKPFKFPSLDELQESPKPLSKKPRVENPIRKELFKVPQKKPDRSSKYRNRCSSNNLKSVSAKKQVPTIKIEGSPLLDVDEAEKLLTGQKLVTQPVKTVLFPASPTVNKNKNVGNNTPKRLTRIDEASPSNASMMDELEFLHLEKTLQSATKSVNKFSSPVSSVCSLLQNTNISNSPQNDKEDAILNEILAIVKEDRGEFADLKQHFARYQSAHENKLNAITKLIEDNLEDKENGDTRRSIRIASQTVKTKFVVSPAISQKVDLRKNTLNKNLSLNLQCESPRTRKAMDMYNNFRSDCTMLCTPKSDKTHLEVTQSSVTRSLSRRIQKQCLLLQDTPKPDR